MKKVITFDIEGVRWFVKHTKDAPLGNDEETANCVIDIHEKTILIWKGTPHHDQLLALSAAICECWKHRND